MEPLEQKLLRMIVSSLLYSDLSREDLIRSVDLLRSGRINKSLIRIISANIEAMYGRGAKVTQDENEQSDLIGLIKRKRLSKGALLEAIEAVTRSSTSKYSEDMTVREIVAKFEQSSPKAHQAALISLLSGSEGIDPYLKGILNRSSSWS